MVSDLNLNLVRTFCLIYELQGIGRAAEKLHLSQPTVSHSLKQLRKAFNDRLFFREGNLLHPTERAQAIYPDLRAALDLIGNSGIYGGKFDPGTTRGEFVLMLSDLGEVVFLPWIQRNLERWAPQATLRVEPLEVPAVPEKLASGEIDAAIQTPFFHSPDVDRTVIFRDRYVALAALDHPRVQGELTVPQLNKERFLRIRSSVGHEAAEAQLLRAGAAVHTGILGTRLMSVPETVMHSELLGLVPSVIVQRLDLVKRLQVLPLPQSAKPMEVALMARQPKRRTASQNWLVNVIIDAAKTLRAETSSQ